MSYRATDKRIEELVYELYGLTQDEIRIVEERRDERRRTEPEA